MSFSEFTPTVIVSVISALLSAGTLILGVIAYRKFLAKELRQKQLEVVCGLVEEMQGNFNLYVFNTSKLQTTKTQWLTLLDISEMQRFDKDFGNFYFFGEEENDYFKKEEERINWNFYSKYYANPLLPKRIAERLRRLNISQWSSIPFGEIRNSACIIIGRKGVYTDSTPCLYIRDSPLKTCNGFKATVLELRIEIEDWLKFYGIKDLNITKSHRYREETEP